MSEISVYLCHDCSKSLGASFFSRNQLNKFTHGHSRRLSCQDCCAKRYADTNPQKKKAKISAGEKDVLGKADDALKVDVNYSKIEPPQALQPANQPKLSKNAIKLNPKQRQSLDPSVQYLENPYSAPIVRDAKKFFLMNYQQPIQIFMQSKTHWRTHVKLAVRAHLTSNSNQVVTKIGLFIPNSHNILECLDHPAHHATINQTLNLLKQCMETNQIHGYIEGQDYDEEQVNRLSLYVKYVVLTQTHTNNRIQMTLVINTHPSNKLAETRLLKLRDSLVEQGKGVFHSIFLNYFVSNKHNNSILGRERDLYHLIYGEEYILEDLHIYHSNNNSLSSLHASKHTLGRKFASSSNVQKLTVNFADMRLHIVPFVFRQANLDAFCQIIKKLREHMQGLAIAKARTSNSQMHMPNTPLLPNATIGPTSLHCLELYGGIGTIGLHLLDLCRAYVCSDENPHNKKCFELSLDLIRDKDTGVANLPYSYIPLSAEQMVQRVDVRRCITGTDSEREAYDVIIVDPPRKGLDDKVIEALLGGNEDASASTSKRKKRKLDENGTADDANSTQIKKKQVLYYISCGFEALKRDLQHLTGVPMSDEYLAWKSAKPHHGSSQTSSSNAGGGGESKQKNSGSVWTIEQVSGFILFPGADHLETFVILTRNV
eukprot:gene26669-32227_t